MIEARFEYICRRCGATQTNPCCDVDMAKRMIYEMATTGEGRDGNGWVAIRPLCVCHCEDGGCGVSDCVGFKVVDTMIERRSR